MKPIIYPYKMGSKSATALAKALGCRKVYPDRKYKPRNNHVIINWGNSSYPKWSPQGERVRYHSQLNTELAVMHASNKASAFRILNAHGVSIPEFTTDKAEATGWVFDGKQVMARTVLNGHSGKGIVYPLVMNAEIPDAPLYVKYINKKAEYRVHIFKGKVIDVQQKLKRKEYEGEINNQIRNHANGWVFCRDNCNPPDDVLDNACAAVNALGLDFGAVDVIYNQHYQKAYVLEVNTAPGLEGTTLINYVNAIKEVL